MRRLFIFHTVNMSPNNSCGSPDILGPSAETPDQSIDYDFAQAELMSQQMGDDPIQEAINAIEKQHVDDKAG